MKLKVFLLVSLLFAIITCCDNYKNDNADIEDTPKKTITVSSSDISKDEIGDFLVLDSEKILFCGPRVLADARKNLPFYSIINGVYNDKFYALVPAFEIESRRESNPKVFPEDLKNVQSEDNFIIAFFKIVR